MPAMADPDRRAAVDRTIEQLTECLRRRDVEGALDLFHPDGVLFGSEEGEWAAGRDDVATLLAGLYRRTETYGWEGGTALTGSRDPVLWFVKPTTLVVQGDDGSTERAPYRVSGVLEPDADGRWRFRLFNGSEPVPPA
jgi:ketosteroid isomerase-like protein